MAKKGTKHKKYSPEFKREAVEKYLDGELGGMTTATRTLGLRSHKQLQDWLRLYKENPELLKQDNRGKASKKDGVRKGRPKRVNLDELSKDEQIEHLKMENVPGCNEKGEVSEKSLEQVRKAVGQADTVFVIAGLTDLYESEGFDRENMKMPAGHLRMIEAAADANKNTVVVLLGGSAMEIPFADQVRGILYMGLGGQYTAEALYDLVYGKCVPSGKLAETWQLKYEDVISSSYYGSKDAIYLESIYTGYRYYDKAGVPVQYPFGYGLSYTEFAYSNLSVSWPHISVDVENTGTYDGYETVQLYLGTSLKDQFTSNKQLKGFDKVYLKKEKRKQSASL